MEKSQILWEIVALTITLLVIFPTLACGNLPLALPASQDTAGLERESLTSPLSTPTMMPPRQPALIPKEEWSPAAQKAFAYVVARDGIPGEALIIAADHFTESFYPGRKFQVVTLQDTRPGGQIYKLLVDLDTGQVLNEAEIFTLHTEAGEAYQARYGKLEPALYERLQTMVDEDSLSVMIWVADPPGKTSADFRQQAFATLAAKYPEAATAFERSGIPFLVADKELAQRIRTEYFEMLDAEMLDWVQPLATELEQQGFTIRIFEGMPAFTALLPKHAILGLSDHSGVGTIYFLGEDPAQADPELPPLPEECLSEETTLAFETIEQKERGELSSAYEELEPGLVIINHPEEMVTLSEGIHDDLKLKLQTMDYNDHFALVVFQGWKSSGGYSTQIRCISRQDNAVNIYVQFRKPRQGEFVNLLVTSPYHLVQVQKVRDWDQEITFNLISDGTNIISRSYFIP
jgi:hypothetical protein